MGVEWASSPNESPKHTKDPQLDSIFDVPETQVHATDTPEVDENESQILTTRQILDAMAKARRPRNPPTRSNLLNRLD
jgi:hypothetical protein